MRYTIIYIVLLFSFPLSGQMSFVNDTIKIKEVVISRKKESNYQTGYKTKLIDSSVLKYSGQISLSEVLSDYTNIFIKSYGMGGSATPSFRGTGAGHTQVAWNNININHPMLGQSDLSIIPSGLIDNIQISFGGASMLVNSGGIGGSINLENKPDWKRSTLIQINPGTGSFGQYTGLIKVKTGNDKFQTSTKLYFQSAENDFRYLNTEISTQPLWETRKNSQVSQQGIMQELYFRKNRNITSLKVWYQSADRNLPSSMLILQPDGNEKQRDESIRNILSYEFNKGDNKYLFTGAYLFSKLNYTNNLASINSQNLSKTMILKTEMERKITEFVRLKTDISEELNYVRSNNYEKNNFRNTITFTACAERNLNDRFGSVFLIREIADRNKLLLPDYSAGIQYRIFNKKDYFIKTNVSRNSKIPSMNDLLWSPGGNRRLKNEYAFIYEFNFEMKQNIYSVLTLKYDISAFRNRIRDMILWHPGEYSYWTAENIKSVNSIGVESSIQLDFSADNFQSCFKGSYSYTKATTVSSNYEIDSSVGKQLMYVPENKANASCQIIYGNVYSTWILNYTGKRYITTENSKFLPAYLINNLIAGFKLPLKSNSVDMTFTIDDIFNVKYQSIAYYPLPGRSYYIKILFQLVK